LNFKLGFTFIEKEAVCQENKGKGLLAFLGEGELEEY
jgi:hypothetical protein